MAKKKGNFSWLALLAVLVMAAFAWYSFSKANSSSENIEKNDNEGAMESVATLQTSTPVEEPVATPTLPVPTKVKSPEELSLEIAPIYKNDETTGLPYDRYYADGFVWYVDSNNIAVKVWDPENNGDTSFEKTGKQGFRLLDGTFVTMEYVPRIPIKAGGKVYEFPTFASWEELAQYMVNVRGAKYTDSFLEAQAKDPKTKAIYNERIQLLRTIYANSGRTAHPSMWERHVRTEDGKEIYVLGIVYDNYFVIAFLRDDQNGEWISDFATLAMNEDTFNSRYEALIRLDNGRIRYKYMTLPNRVEVPEN